MSHAAVSRISSVLSGRRLVLLLGLIVIAFAIASMGRVGGASAEPIGGGDDGIQIDCPLGDGYADPGTTITLPAAGDLPPLTVVCDGDDGHWHAVSAVVRPPSTTTNPVASSGLRAL
jgi:hypothetical protein